ncbi:hypothetical protein L917_20112 [Phytophthora nicotianae]|uniref:Uncharacterized protein n=1 Tax=Phytophthora nicotianae TaxID=4792 RepID=W2K235_PHYNI|nr:hypothetical protein L916_20237 [Phytophthora nicotianae]ETL79193.1 hypothetical protein L917_20112 [Phytophthora nicotianae]
MTASVLYDRDYPSMHCFPPRTFQTSLPVVILSAYILYIDPGSATSPTQHVLVRAQILAGCILYKAQLYIARVLLVVREVSTNSTRNKYPSKHGV